MDPDFLLIRRMKDGDDEAIEEFVRKYYPAVLRYCLLRIDDAGYAQDAVQETFERFFRNFARYRHYGKAANYLYVIAGNVCRDYYRRRREVAAGDAEEVMRFRSRSNGNGNRRDCGEDGFISSVADDHRLQEKAVPETLTGISPPGADFHMDLRADLRMDLRSAFAALPPELRETAILFFCQELKQREIAKILGIGLPLVKYRIRKAREQLQEMLKEVRE